MIKPSSQFRLVMSRCHWFWLAGKTPGLAHGDRFPVPAPGVRVSGPAVAVPLTATAPGSPPTPDKTHRSNVASASSSPSYIFPSHLWRSACFIPLSFPNIPIFSLSGPCWLIRPAVLHAAHLGWCDTDSLDQHPIPPKIQWMNRRRNNLLPGRMPRMISGAAPPVPRSWDHREVAEAE